MYPTFFIVATIIIYEFYFEYLVLLANTYILFFIVCTAYIYYNKKHYLYEEVSTPSWSGSMSCSSCGYIWESRRSTPPAKCPSCNSEFIKKIEFDSKCIKKVEISKLTQSDIIKLKYEPANQGLPTWYIYSMIVFVGSLIFVLDYYF